MNKSRWSLTGVVGCQGGSTSCSVCVCVWGGSAVQVKMNEGQCVCVSQWGSLPPWSLCVERQPLRTDRYGDKQWHTEAPLGGISCGQTMGCAKVVWTLYTCCIVLFFKTLYTLSTYVCTCVIVFLCCCINTCVWVCVSKPDSTYLLIWRG